MGQSSAAGYPCSGKRFTHAEINECVAVAHFAHTLAEDSCAGGSKGSAAPIGEATVHPIWLNSCCCAGDDGEAIAEEVLVVHHDALKTVSQLLRADEVSGFDLPGVPECVIAAKRAQMQRSRVESSKQQGLIGASSRGESASSLWGGAVSSHRLSRGSGRARQPANSQHIPVLPAEDS